VCAVLALPAAARTRPHYGGVLHVETAGDAWQRPGGLARRLVLDGLTTLDARGAVRPALATEWSADNNGHRWQFKLRPDVHFHDGTLLTAVNAAAALQAACAGACPWQQLRAVGGSVVFVSDGPMPNLPALLAGDEFLLALTIGADGKAAGGNVGTGPFQVTGFANGVLTLAANEACWSGRPFVDSVELRVHRAVRDQWLDLSVGRADVVEVPAEMLRQAQQQKLDVVTRQDASLLVLAVNDAGPLANATLRAALSVAVDRATLANVIYQKQGEAAAGLVPESKSGYAFLFPVEQDMNKAHALRGGLSTPPLTMSTEGDGAMQLAAQRIALDLHGAGFTVQMTAASVQHTNLVLRVLPLEGGTATAVLDGTLRAAGEPMAGVADDPSALYRAEHDVLDEHRVIPLVTLPRAYALGARVRDLRMNANGVPGLADVSLEDAQ
jgi:peptide/nickel transport system substrate-binding protein